jgi:hypothetical protein
VPLRASGRRCRGGCHCGGSVSNGGIFDGLDLVSEFLELDFLLVVYEFLILKSLLDEYGVLVIGHVDSLVITVACSDNDVSDGGLSSER